MSFETYSSALRSIASAEADGDDVSDQIRRLAMSAGMEPSMVRHDVTEAAEIDG